MKSIIILVFILFSTGAAFSQEYRVDTLHEKHDHYWEVDYKFPIINGSDSTIANRINNYLIKDFLNIEPGEVKQSIFENVWGGEEAGLPLIGDLVFNVSLLNARIYSVTLSGEGCGAYCEPFDISYNFDLKTGANLPLDTLFTIEGAKDLLNYIVSYKVEKINNKIAEAKAALKSDTLISEDIDYYEEVLYIFENCYIEYDNLEDMDYKLENDIITVSLGRCSAHVNQGYDDLGDFHIPINIKEWEEYLSDYGKSLLL